MSNELVPFSADQLPSTDLVTEEQLKEISKDSSFLQRIQLVTRGKYVDSGKIPPGNYGIPLPGGEEITNLGSEIDLLPLCMRMKALDMRDLNAVIAVYDMTSSAFEEIKVASNEAGSGCMWGPSFLVYERSTGSFYEFFLGNKSGRAEAANLIPFLPISEETAAKRGVDAHGPVPCTLKNRLTTGKYRWHVPVVTKCSEPFTNLPPTADIVDEIKKFASVKDNGIQNVTEEEAKATKKRAR